MTHVALVVVGDGAGRVLTVSREGRHDDRAIPGGHVEPGETHAQAALRELFEETGVTGRNPQMLFDEPRSDGGVISVWFIADADHNALGCGLVPETGESVRWAHPSELLAESCTYRDWTRARFAALFAPRIGVSTMLSADTTPTGLLRAAMVRLRAAYLVHQNAHWESKGVGFYGDHLLYERIYGAAAKDADAIAERGIGLYGNGFASLDDQAATIAACVSDVSAITDVRERSCTAERLAAEAICCAYDGLSAAGALTKGLDDLLLSLASNREDGIYLLRQRDAEPAADGALMSDRTAVRIDTARMGDAVDPAGVGVTCRMGDGAGKLVWIQLAEVGQFRGHPAGPFALTPRVFDEIVRNFERDGLPVPIDYEHASEADPTSGNIPVHGAPATGWVHKVENRNEAGLWGLVEWSPTARDQITSGAYRYLSPAVRFGAKDRVTGEQVGAKLTSAALTNQPFLKGMRPLAAKDDAKHHDATPPNAPASAEMVAPDTTPTITTETTMQDNQKDLAAKDAEISRLTLQLTDATARAAKLEAEVTTLRDDAEKRQAKEIENEAAAIMATHAHLTEDTRPHLMRMLKADPEAVRALYPMPTEAEAKRAYLMRQIVPPQPRTVDQRTMSAAGGADETPSIFVLPDGTEVDERVLSESVRETTQRLMSDEKLSYEGASSKAFTLHNAKRRIQAAG
jgi:phage I-like protein/8-oxo-dGTP pyrophosphatase MutT (NUDIX family)